MGRQVSVKGFRIGINEDWIAQWFAPRGRFGIYLKIDHIVRDLIFKALPKGSIEKVVIQRPRNILKIVIYAAKPGLVIGSKGAQIKAIEKGLKETLVKNNFKNIKFTLDIEEVKDLETKAYVIAADIASQLEKRARFRYLIKQSMNKIERNPKVKGAKIAVAGRLDGSEMSRREHFSFGTIPLQTLRSKIDYGYIQAITKYGTIGIKVWIYTGEAFEKEKEEKVELRQY